MDAYNMDTQIKKVLNGMGFPADTWTKAAGVLSGGEQTRLRLARLLLERPDLLILDEAGSAWELDMVDKALLQKAVLERPAEQECVLTAHAAPKWMLDAADYATEMKCHRHPYQRGISARQGIEY